MAGPSCARDDAMIHLFINALAASAGGGLTYIRNVIPQLAVRKDVRCTVLLDTRLGQELREFSNINFEERESPASTALRFLAEQCAVPGLIRGCGADALLSTGNFAVLNSPAPQILLSRNSLYTSRDFFRDLRERGDYRLWLDTQVKSEFARWSIQAADVVVAPSEAFAEELRRWSRKPVVALHHGFDREVFVRDHSPLAQSQQAKVDHVRDSFRLLFVSHYNYYRNFETVIRALPLIKQRLAPRRVALLLTCDLVSNANPGSYRTDDAAELVRALGLSDNVVELGTVQYGQLHQVYGAADCYVSPAYAESFAHPLVEAMSSGLPVVASDLAVHREICADAALYFARFSPQELAERVAEVALSAAVKKQLSSAGVERSCEFSWKVHVDGIVELGKKLIAQHGAQEP
jgi:glycosyltransferase involved in cell wall biosynthesis